MGKKRSVQRSCSWSLQTRGGGRQGRGGQSEGVAMGRVGIDSCPSTVYAMQRNVSNVSSSS